jgi:hypothetical protein
LPRRAFSLDDQQSLVPVVADHPSSLSYARANTLYQLLGCQILDGHSLDDCVERHVTLQRVGLLSLLKHMHGLVSLTPKTIAARTQGIIPLFFFLQTKACSHS